LLSKALNCGLQLSEEVFEQPLTHFRWHRYIPVLTRHELLPGGSLAWGHWRGYA
jgi:hypothetical protein